MLWAMAVTRHWPEQPEQAVPAPGSLFEVEWQLGGYGRRREPMPAMTVGTSLQPSPEGLETLVRPSRSVSGPEPAWGTSMLARPGAGGLPAPGRGAVGSSRSTSHGRTGARA